MYPVISASGIQYLGDSSLGYLEVHDLLVATETCEIADIVQAGHAVRFDPDTLEEAHRAGYDNCAWCIGGPAHRWSPPQ